MVLFGATGDLAKKKLLPALWKGFLTGRIPLVHLFGVARRKLSDETFRKIARDACKPSAENEEMWRVFEQKLFYYPADFTDESSYAGLKEIVSKYNNLLFILATQPEMFPVIAKNFADVKNPGYKRLLVEKPFGRDLATAEKLNRETKKYFGDDVYRIDHYLGKGIIRNLLTLRFSNEVFKAVWNNKHIERVEIIHSETIGIEERAEYYDSIGAIRDMLQSHLLQMLSVIAMNEPKDAGSARVFVKKAQMLESLALPRKENVVLGQYEGYEKDVGHSSRTESFVALQLFLKQRNWRGVPFYLVTGKKLDKAFAKIVVVFKKPGFAQDEKPNTLEITIQPEEKIIFTFNIRDQINSTLKPFRMEYCDSCEFGVSTPEAYEKLIADALRGDKSLFASWREIRASWKFSDKLVHALKHAHVHPYAPGSRGPQAALEKGLNPQ